MTSSPGKAAIVAGLALSLAACGKVGTLEQPAPLYGAKAKARYEAAKQAAVEAKAQRSDSGKPEPLPADPTSSMDPPR